MRLLKLIFLGGALISLAAVADQKDQPGQYHPGKEKAISGVENDITGTYKNWKDRKAIEKSIANGMESQYINYKDVRWLKRDEFNGELLREEARELYARTGKTGKSCASCHGSNGEELRGVAAKYPTFDKEYDRVIPLTTRIRNCSEKYVGAEMPEDSGDNTLMTWYVTDKSDGVPIDIEVDTPGPVQDAFYRGRDLFFKRVGQFNFACASCHTPPTVLKQLRGMRPSTPYGDAVSYPIWEFPAHPERHYLLTMQLQIKACQAAARMKTSHEGSLEYTDMEVFIKSLSNGYEINSLSSYYGETLD